MANPRGVFRFGDFELDVAGYELRGSGRPIRLERQPMDLLIMLVERRGQLVSREDIVDRLWGKDVFVDVDTGVHTAIRKIRRALRDSPEEPVFIETVSGKGYRFIASFQVAAAAPDTMPVRPQPPHGLGPGVPPGALRDSEDATAAALTALHTGSDAPTPSQSKTAKRGRIVIGLLIAAIAIGIVTWEVLRRAAEPSRATIAVLPFESLGGDPDRAYLAEGLTEEITTWLGQVDPDRLSVVSRTSATISKRAAKPLAEIGRELSADYLLESSVRAEGGRVRITARLIRARDQVQVWSEAYNRELTSMLGLQQELGAAIAEQIRFRLSPQRFQSLARREPRVAAAYEHYLRGLTFANQRTPSTTQKAIEHYERATTLDPEYALAWSALAAAHSAGAFNSDVAPLEVTSRVRDAARRAVRANPALAEAQYALGYLNWALEWEWPAAEIAFRRAIDLDPRHTWAHMSLGHLLSQSGRHSEALVPMRRARELDPLNAMTYALSSQVAFQARDYPGALDHASQAIALDQGFWIGYMMRGQAYEQSGQSALALDALAIAARFSGGNSKPVSLRGYVLAKAGRREEARQVLMTLETLSQGRYVPPYAMALVHAGLGERAAAFTWLDRAFEAHDVHLVYLPVDAKWDPYRADPRFADLLTRAGFTGAFSPSPSAR
jgi:TolB-like protein/DNA-binding winged helix-turn-helix (wHTH) protein/Flp pilus assembly protein TadD